MSERETVSEAAVEAAAKAIHDAYEAERKDLSTWGNPVDQWDDIGEPSRARFRRYARSGLSAALPLIVAGERERIAKMVDNDFHWTLPLYDAPRGVNEITDDGACMVQDQIVAAIRADKGGDPDGP